MAYTVFFREPKRIVKADDFIRQQPIVHQAVLSAIADDLAASGKIGHPRAKKNSNGDWSVLLIDNGDAYSYTLFISQFERDEARQEAKAKAPSKKGTLVIIDPAGARDSVGGYHPGYWFVEQYVNFIDENQRALFLQTVYQLEHNIPSENYRTNGDGSVTITVGSLTCRGNWV
jgi:hypothetical protein